MRDPTVFMVDSDQAHCDSVRELVNTLELPVETFESVEDFLDAFEPTRAGCLLLEVRAARRGGRSVQEELAAAGIPIVLISDYGDNATVLRLSKARAADSLQKPYRAQQLIAAIQEVFRKRPSP